MTARKRIDECLFCRRRKCYVRILSHDGTYDEVACRDHIHAMEKHYDSTHKGRMMTNSSCSSPQRRGVALRPLRATLAPE